MISKLRHTPKLLTLSLLTLWIALLATSQAAALGMGSDGDGSLAPPPISAGIAYQILDHPDGSLGGPDYALRLDGLSGNNEDDFTFSSVLGGALLTILWDDVAETIKIEGTVYGGKLVGDDWVDPQLWKVSFLYGGVTHQWDDLESTPGMGVGTIMGTMPGSETINLVDKANMAGLAFRLDTGHRIAGDIVTGHGWLTHDAAERSSFQDWLFTVGDPIPEPSTAILLGGGLMALAARRRQLER